MEVKKEISFGKGKEGNRIHLIVDVDFFMVLYVKKSHQTIQKIPLRQSMM